MKCEAEKVIRCVVTCINSQGDPEFFPVKVAVTDGEYEDGIHYDAAVEAALRADYEMAGVVFDEDDGPPWLFENLTWEGLEIYRRGKIFTFSSNHPGVG